MKIALLDAATLGDDLGFDCFEALGELVVYPTTSQNEVISRLDGIDVAILNKVKLTSDVLSHLSSLKLICITATGYDNVDISYCASHSIAVCNVSGYSTQSVAQLTLAMALSLSDNLPLFDKYVKSGDYTKSGIQNKLTPVFHELYGKTWGIVGYGSIGKQVASVAKALGCDILAFKRTPESSIDCVSLEELMAKSDIISVHLPSSEATRGIISREIIGLIKKNAILINAARGAVIDEQAITDAVISGNIGGYATDVYTTEPFPAEHPYNRLFGYDNVIFTPHMAWGAYETRVRLLDEVAKNIKSFCDGGKRSRVDLL